MTVYAPTAVGTVVRGSETKARAGQAVWALVKGREDAADLGLRWRKVFRRSAWTKENAASVDGDDRGDAVEVMVKGGEGQAVAPLYREGPVVALAAPPCCCCFLVATSASRVSRREPLSGFQLPAWLRPLVRLAVRAQFPSSPRLAWPQPSGALSGQGRAEKFSGRRTGE